MDQIAGGLAQLATQITSFFVPLAAASAVAVALLEAFKKLFSIQGRFHRRAVLRWLCEGSPKPEGGAATLLGALHGVNHYVATASANANVAPGKAGPAPGAVGPAKRTGNYDFESAYTELKQLTTGLPTSVVSQRMKVGLFRFRSIDRALFELETPRMMAQVQDASDAALNNPVLYKNFFTFCTRGCTQNDVDAWKTYIAAGKVDDGESKAVSDLYARIRLLTRRQLDSFQSVTVSRWAELNQLWAVVVGAVVLLVAQMLGTTPKDWNVIHMIATAVFGGMLAPVAKDLVTGISQFAAVKK